MHKPPVIRGKLQPTNTNKLLDKQITGVCSTPSMAKNKASPKIKFQSSRTEVNKLQLGFYLKPLDCFVSDQTY